MTTNSQTMTLDTGSEIVATTYRDALGMERVRIELVVDDTSAFGDADLLVLD